MPEPPPGLFPFPPSSPALDGGPYVFPVFGNVAYGDTYGEFRADVSYHHGDDIFGELGQPILAVADGTIFSLGWNKIGGNRLWLRDRQGNAFYYAHLSAFSTLVFNGARVKAGQVVGFMGNTGDAEGTPTHLHFEVHPVSLLYLGYDGAIDPTPFLDDAKRLQRLPFPIPPGWAPSVTGRQCRAAAGRDPALGLRHLERGRPRPRVAAPRDRGAAGRGPSRSSSRRGYVRPFALPVVAVVRLGPLSMSLMKRRVSGPGDRVVEQSERDARDQQHRVARRVVALALEALARAAEILDRVAQLVADVVVGRDAVAMRTGSSVAHQLAVQLVRGAEGTEMSPRSFSSDIARSTYGLMLSAAS